MTSFFFVFLFANKFYLLLLCFLLQHSLWNVLGANKLFCTFYGTLGHKGTYLGLTERIRQLSTVPECDPVTISRCDTENKGGMERGVHTDWSDQIAI